MRNTIKAPIITLILIGLVLLVNSCREDKPITGSDIMPPTVSTIPVSSISFSSAVSGGDITYDGGGAVTARGVCWSEIGNPTINNNKTTDYTGPGSYISVLNNLTANTTYFLKAYAINAGGVGYGEQVQFTTLVDYTGQMGTIIDIDGNIYPTIGIGNQIWTVLNLKTTKYLNGNLIGTTTPATMDISGETAPKYQWAYAGNESNTATYGRLYTWHAVTDSRGICPVGWHVPTDSEWTILTTQLGGESVAGGKLKETGTSHWSAPNTQATNSSGFFARPGGSRDVTGTFSFMGTNGGWWSATEYNVTTGLFRFLFYESGLVSRGYFSKSYGYYVRCVKDN